MDSYLVKTCEDCGAVFDALDRINCVLARYAKNRYQNDAYLTDKVFPKSKIKLLSWYKDILTSCTWNGAYFEPTYPTAIIISRVKILTSGL